MRLQLLVLTLLEILHKYLEFPLEAGEVEVLAQLLKEFIKQSFESSTLPKKEYKKPAPKEPQIDEDDDEEVPF